MFTLSIFSSILCSDAGISLYQIIHSVLHNNGFILQVPNIIEQVVVKKMESFELSAGFSFVQNCLGHEGTLNLLERWREIRRERQLKDDDEIRNNTITVNVGPQFEADIASILIFIYLIL